MSQLNPYELPIEIRKIIWSWWEKTFGNNIEPIFRVWENKTSPFYVWQIESLVQQIIATYLTSKKVTDNWIHAEAVKAMNALIKEHPTIPNNILIQDTIRRMMAETRDAIIKGKK